MPWAVAEATQKTVWVLEPRRLAARFSASFVCERNNKKLGNEIGYHFRFERKESLEKFKEGEVRILICTDVAARGTRCICHATPCGLT